MSSEAVPTFLNVALRPQKPSGLLGTAHDGHFDFHTLAPELCKPLVVDFRRYVIHSSSNTLISPGPAARSRQVARSGTTRQGLLL